MYLRRHEALQLADPVKDDDQAPGRGGRLRAAALVGHENRLLEAISAKRTYVDAYSVALVYVGLGQHDNAIDWLDKAAKAVVACSARG